MRKLFVAGVTIFLTLVVYAQSPERQESFSEKGTTFQQEKVPPVLDQGGDVHFDGEESTYSGSGAPTIPGPEEDEADEGVLEDDSSDWDNSGFSEE